MVPGVILIVELVLGVILSIFTELIKDNIKKYVVSPIIRHISYAFRCDTYVKTLQGEVDQLKIERLRLQQSVNDVTNWLSTAGKEIDEAEEVIQGKEEAKKKCFAGFCPNVKTRYQLSKKAHKKALAIGRKLQDAQGLVPILQQNVEPSVYSTEALPSRVLILNQIMDALKYPNLNMIGVYGMGGVGKTTLAKEVQGKAVEQKLFETVVRVAVSQTPEERRIQGDIADSLGLKFDAEGVPGRADQLRQRLKNAKVLIILDDLWQKLDLNAVGIPFGDASEDCKILLTSRSKQVLSNEMLTQKEFSLDVLKEEETWRLFEMSVGTVEDPELHPIATEIAKKCSGLPLLILKVATDLRNKNSHVWNDMRNRLSSGANTEIYKKVHKVIESSYEKLSDEEAKSLFLLCPLFGNSNIEIHRLLMYCKGLGLFKNLGSIEGARNRVLSLIDKLKNESLLMDGDRAGFVKIHDVVRDIALAIASRVQHAFIGTSEVRATDLRNKYCTRISLPHCDICELPGVLECPEAELFSLFAKDSLDIPDSFFEGVPKLKVVDFTGVRFVSGLPSSLGFLVGLQTLRLERCRFSNVAIIAELKQLECLSFAGSNIEELPGEIKGLTRLKLLDLKYCHSLKVIPANVLSNLYLLEELYLFYSFHGWETEGNASLVELKNLSHLTTLEIQVDDDKLLPEDWFFNGLRNYKIYIGKWYTSEFRTSWRILKLELRTSIGLMYRIKEFVRGIEVLELRDVKGVENLLYDCGSDRVGSFGKLRSLKISKCDTLKSLFSHSFAKYLPQLQEVEVESCGNMEAIVGKGCEEEMIEFTHLTSLKLKELPLFRGFRKTSGKVAFPKLTRLEVTECKSLKYVFTTSMVESLEQLIKLEISQCVLMEEVIQGKKLGSEIEEEEESINRIVFPKLDHLQLDNLQKLKRFSSGYPIDFPSLRELKIKQCGAIENILSKSSDRSNNNESIDEYLFNELVGFPNLTKLEVTKCKNLKYVSTNSMVKSLKELTSLKISECELMEEIVQGKKLGTEIEEEDSINRIVFPKLDDLSLRDLSKLKRFSSGYPIDFPSLRELRIINCNALKNLVSKLSDRSNNNELVTFSNLEKLDIHGMDKLRYIWSKDMDEAFSLKNLKSIHVSDCRNLKYVFPLSIARGLLQLQELRINLCGVEVIIANPKDETVEWPNLTHLAVFDCKNFISFGSNNSKFIPNVEHLELDHRSLKAIQSNGLPIDFSLKLKSATLTTFGETDFPFLFGFLRRIYSLEQLTFRFCSFGDHIFSLEDEREVGDQQRKYQLHSITVRYCGDLMSIDLFSASFQNLTTLHVEYCEKMTRLVTASTAKTMVQLVELKVSHCRMMEEIVAKDSGCTEHDEIIFKKLKLLELSSLDRLNSFCSGKYNFSFPLLEKVAVEDCSKMKIFSSGILSTPKLQGIEFNYEDEQWEGDVNATISSQLSEWVGGPLSANQMQLFKGLRKLIVIDCNWVDVIFNLEELSAEDGNVGLLPELNELELINLPVLTQLCNKAPRGILEFNKLKVLIIENCRRLVYAFTWSMASCLSQLEEIEVRNCEMMETIIREEEAEDVAAQVTLDSLKSVLLDSLPKFSTFYSGRGDLECPSLKEISIRECPSIKALTMEDKQGMKQPNIHSSCKFIPNVEHLEIDHRSLKAILSDGLPIDFSLKLKSATLTSFGERHIPFLFGFLRRIYSLEQLTFQSCSFGDHIFSLEDEREVGDQQRKYQLHSITVEDCDDLMNIALFSASFQNLTTLNVESFHKKTSLVTASTAKTMVQLAELKVSSCRMLKEIVATDSGCTEHDVIIFKKLKLLELKFLDRLNSFCSGNYNFSFPLLEQVTVRYCSRMKIFSSGILSTPKLQGIEFNYRYEQWEGDVNAIISSQLSEWVGGPILANQMQLFKGLRKLIVRDCNCVDVIFNLEELSAEDGNVGLLPELNELELINLPVLTQLCNKAPRGILEFNKLKVLKIENCRRLVYAFTWSMASCLSQLQEIEVRNCEMMETIIREEEAEDVAAQVTLDSLKSVLLDSLPKFSTFYSGRGDLECPSLKEIRIRECPSIKALTMEDKQVMEQANIHFSCKAPRGIFDFNKLKVLKIENCSRLVYAFTWSMASCLFQLQEIEVKDCEMMKTIIMEDEAEDIATQVTLGSLESFLLESLPKLSTFYLGRGDLECPLLKKITIRKCPSIKAFTMEDKQGMEQPNIHFSYKVFSHLEELVLDIKSITTIMQFELPTTFFSNVKKLGLRYFSGATTKSHVPLLHFLSIIPNLDILGISHSSVKELFKFDSNLEAAITLPQITSLHLQNLDDLKKIWWQNSEAHVSLFQSLQTLEVRDCGQIMSLASSAASFQNLTTLKVYQCNQLRNLITASVAKSMVQLETLSVKSCKMLMEIVGDGNDGTADEIVFTKLNTLELFDLQSLKSFSSGHYAFKFPCLENVFVFRCLDLRTFSPGNILAPMLTYVKRWNYDHDGNWEGDLNTTIEHLYKKMVGFKYLEDVKLSLFPNLKEQWANQFPFLYFSSLERLEVDDCAMLTNAIPSQLLHRLESLKVLIVEKCDSVEQVFDLEGLNAYDMEKLNELQLIDLPRLTHMWSKDPQKILSFESLQLLKVQNCGNLTYIFNLSMALSLPNLQHLEVKSCSLVKHIIAKEDVESTMQELQPIFPSLQTMKLQCLPNLSSFCYTSGFMECPSLKFVEVVQCTNLELFGSSVLEEQDSCLIIEEKKEQINIKDPDSMVGFLGNMIGIPKLEELKVEWNSLKDKLNNNNRLEFLSRLNLIHLTGFEGEYAILPPNLLPNFPKLQKLALSDASMELIILHNEHLESVGLLTKLALSKLPKLKHLVPEDSQLVPLFQNLEELEVCECSRLKIIVPSMVAFQNLTDLCVSKCDGLINLITASTAKSLVQLKRMTVNDCKMIQEIVAIVSDEVEYEIRFSQLEHLELDHLPCFTSFCSGNYDFFFPLLVEVVVIKCPTMKIFAEKAPITPKLRKVQTGRREYEWEWEGSLNNTIKALIMEKEAEEIDA